MSDTETYQCPWCHADRPLTAAACPSCGRVDEISVLPHHVRVLPGGTAVRGVPPVAKILAVVLILWLIMTAALVLKYG